MTAPALLTAEGVSLRIGDRTVLAPTTLTAYPGTMTAIIGLSGSGKTTLLHTLGLLHRPTTGTVTIAGAATTRWHDGLRRRFWRDRAAFVFQDHGLIEDESAAYNVSLANPPFFPSRAARNPRVQDALRTVGLDTRAAATVATLSGGEKQRVALARALFKHATYVFADEPTASLDTTNRHRVTTLLRTTADQGAIVLIATHDETLTQACDTTHPLTAPTP